MSPPNIILVADDDENDVQMTRAALQPGGAEVAMHTVRDGAEALDYLHGRGAFQQRPPGHPAVLLLDLNMPRVDGWEVLRQVKSDDALRTIPVVVFTSSSRDRDVEQCYRLGVNAYVVKPIDFKRFAQVVQEIQAFWIGCNLPPVPAPGRTVPSGPAGVPAGSPP